MRGKGLVRALVLVYRASARACAHVVSEPCWERRIEGQVHGSVRARGRPGQGKGPYSRTQGDFRGYVEARAARRRRRGTCYLQMRIGHYPGDAEDCWLCSGTDLDG